MSKQIKVILVNDLPIVDAGALHFWRNEPDIRIIAHLKDLEEAGEFLPSQPDGVLVARKRENDENFLSQLASLVQKYKELYVLVISNSEEAGAINEILQSGAIGIVMEKVSQEELTRAVRKVAEGQSYYSIVAAKAVLDKISKGQPRESKPADNRSLFTPREIEILGLIARDKTNSNIADRLYISTRTVEAHKRNLLEKANVNHVGGLVVFALKNGILRLEEL